MRAHSPDAFTIVNARTAISRASDKRARVCEGCWATIRGRSEAMSTRRSSRPYLGALGVGTAETLGPIDIRGLTVAAFTELVGGFVFHDDP